MTEPIELYRKYRPARFKDVIGQDNAKRSLIKMLKDGKVPHAILFTGPSGTGKTTLARIMKDKLGCDSKLEGKGVADFVEINAAEARGIDIVRDLKMRVSLGPTMGSCRVFLFDEAHKLTDDAQSALLKMTEDIPSHVYYMFATTDASKIKKTLHSRFTEIKLDSVNDTALKELIKRTAVAEQKTVSDELADRIAECAEGGARKALVLLHQVLGIEDEQQRLDAVIKSDTKRQAIELCKALTDRKSKWANVKEILKQLDGEDPEQVRRLVLAWASGGLLNRDDKLCYYIILCFEGDFFNSGRAGLVRAAYEVMEKRG